MAIIGIDLGTTYCAASRFLNGEPEVINLGGHATLPSVVGVQPGGKIAVGWTAKRNQAKNPQDTVVEIKRKMGDDVKVSLGEKQFAPQAISSMILKKIKELAEDELGEEVTGAVITCPAYFKEPQRQATKEAGQLAGLNVLRVVNEPTAAAYAYGLNQKDDQENLFLVYDLGGGTFDVTVISMTGGNLEVLGTGGDPKLGGGNFDDCIVEWMMKSIKKQPQYNDSLTDEQQNTLRMRLKSHAEEAKKILCGPPPRQEYQFQLASVCRMDGKPVPFSEILTLEKFNQMIAKLVHNSFKWIDVAMEVPKEKNYIEKDITAILLVGGSTRVPLIREELAKRFPNTPIRGIESGINPDEIVAVGAGIIAAEEDPESDEISDNELIDVTGHTLSVAVFDMEKNKEVLSPLIKKETAIPASEDHKFASSGNFTRSARIKVYQGEGTEIDPEKVTMIGEFNIQLEPIKDPTPLTIGLKLDENGLLLAHATNDLNGNQEKCKLNYSGSAKKSKQELKKIEDELKKAMKDGVNPTPNPLDQQPPIAPPGSRASQQPQSANSAPPSTPSNEQTMNPIIKELYDRAIMNFTNIPEDRRPQVMQLVSEIASAAKAGDDLKQISLYDPLNQLLRGVG